MTSSLNDVKLEKKNTPGAQHRKERGLKLKLFYGFSSSTQKQNIRDISNLPGAHELGKVLTSK